MGFIPLELSPADIQGAAAIEEWLRANAVEELKEARYGRHASLIHLAEGIEEAVQGVFPGVFIKREVPEGRLIFGGSRDDVVLVGHDEQAVEQRVEAARREHEQHVAPTADPQTIVAAMDAFYSDKGPAREETAADYRE